MSGGFEYDDEVPMFVDEEAEATSSAWGADEEIKYDEYLEVEEEKTVFARLVDLSKESRRATIPLLIARTTKHLSLGAYLTEDVWNSLPDGDTYPFWKSWMKDFTCAQVAKVATRLLTTCVYGYQPHHYRGYTVGGNWDGGAVPVFTPSTEEDVYFIPVTPDLEVAAMGAAACVKLDSDSKTTRDASGEPTTITTYVYKDHGATTKHPLDLKKALAKFVALKPGDRFDAKTASKTPFVWETAARVLCKERVIVPTMTPISAYHLLVGKKITLPKGKVDVSAMIKVNLNINTYYHTLKHSWFFGGLFLRNASFLIYCQEAYFPEVPWSGSFPKQLPVWCRKYGMRFERDGCSLGDPNLNLDVKSVVSRREFTGVVWNPSGIGNPYVKAVGVAIPVSLDMGSAKSGLEWCGANERVMIALVNSPRPFILCIRAEKLSEFGAKCFEPYTSTLFAAYWQKAATIGFYNFVTNLMRTAYPDCPALPCVTATKITSSDVVGNFIQPVALPYCRYLAEETKVAVDEVEAFEKYFMAGAAAAREKPSRPAPTSGDGPAGKRAKRDD